MASFKAPKITTVFLTTIVCLSRLLRIFCLCDKNKNGSTVVFYHQQENSFYPSVDISISMDSMKSEGLISTPVIEEMPLNSTLFYGNKFKRNARVRGFSSETKMEILRLHNLYRGNVTPPAGNMAFMEWDKELANLAQIWAEKCVFEHGRPPNKYPHSIGQNLYLGSDPTGYLAIWMWYEEYLNYDLRAQYCTPNTQCGHYVQLAWAESSLLGCGIKSCPRGYLIVCHYSPWAVSKQQMYLVARPCSQCPDESGSKCYRNLCMTQKQCQRNPEKCAEAKCDLQCHNCGRLDKSKCRCECADGWDSPDCSRRCTDRHEWCGKNPGWPAKSSCSSNKNSVAMTHCRQMCQKCNPFEDGTKFNHICCFGIICPDGYVLDFDRKPCRCSLLCPGSKCDVYDGSGSSLACTVKIILATLITLVFQQKYNRCL